MKAQFKEEIRFCKFFLIFITTTCSISAYIHRDNTDALISLFVFMTIFGGITLYALIVRIKYLKEIKDETSNKDNKK